MRLLLAEDDVSLGEGIRAGLALDGYNVDWVTDGMNAEKALRSDYYDLVVLDLGLPERSGLDVLTEMRTRGDRTPVLILTALNTIADRVRGLDSGGDDYLTKPFDLDELSARVRALVRRSNATTPAVLRHAEITVDTTAHAVKKGKERIKISPHEFIILRMLMENAGTVISRSRLEEALYGWNMEVESNTVEVHIHFLRKKLGDGLIRTVRGVGYMVDREDDE